MKKIILLALILVGFSPCVFAKRSKVVIPEGSGYVGTLPNLEDRFQRSRQEESKPSFQYEDGFNSDDDIKQAPVNNPAFVNIILKKDKTSKYVNDLNEIIPVLERLQTSIEEKDDVQKFNARAYFLKEEVEFFRDKYENQAESSYLSYKKLMQLNMHVQAIAMLRRDNEVFSPYVTSEGSGNMFSQNGINNQLDYLLDEIKSTVVILREAK